MAEEVGTIQVDITGDDDDLKKAVNSAKASIQDLGRSFELAGSMFTRAAKGMVNAMGSLIQLAGEQEAAELKLASAIQGSGQAVDIEKIKAYAAALQNVTTFGDETTISAAAMMQTFGFTEDALMKLLPRAQNLAAFLGRDLNQVAMQLGKSTMGTTGELQKMGISLTEVQKKAFDAADQMGRAAILANIIDTNVGDAARTLGETAKGSMTRFANAVGDLGEELGEMIKSPIGNFARTLTGYVTLAASAIADLSDETKALLGQIAIGAAIFTTLGAAIIGAVSFGILLEVAVTAIAGALSAIAAVALPVIAILLTIAAVAGIIINHWDKLKVYWNQAVNRMKMEWAEFVEKSGLDFSGFGALIKSVWEGVLSNFNAIKRRVSTNWQLLIVMMTTSLSDLVTTFGEFSNAIDEFMGIETKGNIWARLTEGLGNVRAGAFVEISKIQAGVYDVVSEVKKEAKEGTGIIVKTAAGAAKELSAGLKTVYKRIKSLMPDIPGMDAALAALKKFEEGLSVEGGKSVQALQEVGKEVKKEGKTRKQVVQEIQNNIDAMVAGRAEEREKRLAFTESIIRATEATDSATESLAASVATIGETIAQGALELAGKFGKLGTIINSAVRGFETGGIWGAIIAVILELIAMMPSFEKLIAVFETDLGYLVEALDPLLEAFLSMTNIISLSLVPVVDALGAVIDELVEGFNPLMRSIGMITASVNGFVTIFLTLLKPVFEVFGGILHALGVGIGAFAVAIGWVVNAIADVITEIIDAFAGFIGFFDEKAGRKIRAFSDEITRSKMDIKALESNLSDLVDKVDNTESLHDQLNRTEEERIDQEKTMRNVVNDVVEAKEEEVSAIKEATAALLNIPSGFKIAQARFSATSPGMMGGGYSPMGAQLRAGISTQNITVNIENIRADSPEDLARALAQETAWRNLVNTGSTVNSAPSPGRK